MQDETWQIISRFVSEAHKATLGGLLSITVTDFILNEAYKDVCNQKMKNYLKIYLDLEERSKKPFVFESDKETNEQLMIYTLKELSTNYELYKAYKKEREARHLDNKNGCSLPIVIDINIEDVENLLIRTGVLNPEEPETIVPDQSTSPYIVNRKM